jgi:SAM-dependent methyltransferase
VTSGYHESRFAPDQRRDVLWQTLWRHVFSRRVATQDCVLDLGSGYGSFINQVQARRRIAVDAWPGFIGHLAPGVEGVVGDVTELGFIEDGSVDFAFASNLFEHLTQAALARVLEALRSKLTSRGSLTLLQPNYRYAYREYFDDYTHMAVWSHVSLADFLTAQGWEVLEVQPRFLPLTIKSRLPVHPLLIRAWLHSPFKPGGKQMLLHAKPRR